jgi:thioredoxin
MDHIKELTDATFQREVIDADTPILVDFSTVQCAPCRALLPTVAALATDWRGRCAVGKMDIDENPAVAQRYGIRSVPTLLLFRRGQVVAQIVGAVPRAKIEEQIRKAVATAA